MVIIPSGELRVISLHKCFIQDDMLHERSRLVLEKCYKGERNLCLKAPDSTIDDLQGPLPLQVSTVIRLTLGRLTCPLAIIMLSISASKILLSSPQ